MKRGEVLRRDAVKNVAVRGWFLLEETLFHQTLDRLRDFRRPIANACVQDPPVDDSIDRVLSVRVPGEVVQNFGRGRWEREVGWHTLERSSVALALTMPSPVPGRARLTFPGVDYSLGWPVSPRRMLSGNLIALFLPQPGRLLTQEEREDNFILLASIFAGVAPAPSRGQQAPGYFCPRVNTPLSSRITRPCLAEQAVFA